MVFLGNMLVNLARSREGQCACKSNLLLASKRGILLGVLERYAFGFYDVVSALERLRSHAELREVVPRAPRDYELQDLRDLFRRVRDECETLGLHHSADLAERFEARYSTDQPKPSYSTTAEHNFASIKNDIETLNGSFRSELRKELFVRLMRDKESYFEQDRLFGPLVGDAFPLCAHDTRNAGTCFAFERYDACVFHLVQVLQIGINVLAQKLGVSFEYAQWERVLQDVDKAVRGRGPSYGPDWTEHKTLFAAAASHFYLLKEAIRNHFIHGRARYDEGQALSVLTNVREFMQSLAAGGLSEPA